MEGSNTNGNPNYMATGGVVSGLTGIISALAAGLGGNPQSDYTRKLLDKLMNDKDFLSSMPFSKEELFNEIFPQLQQMFTGASDVAAGSLAPSIAESGIAGGQPASEYYMQALAPVIAEGQNKSANAFQQFVGLFANMDDAAKNRLMSVYNTAFGGANQLESMSPIQKAIIGFMSGADLGSKAFGNIAYGSARANKTA